MKHAVAAVVRFLRTATLVLAATAAINTTYADPTIFFGEDLNPGNTLPPNGDADTARSDFLDSIAGTGVENMDGFVAGTTAPLTLQFTGSSGPVTANLTDTGTRPPFNAVWGASFDGRFAISGTQFWQTAEDFQIEFSTPVSVFGFFATDGGDGPGQLTLHLTLSGGGTTDVLVPHSVGAFANGAVMFFGFTDSATSYSSISFLNSDPGHDFFGFDDWTVGTPAPKSVALDIKPGSDPNSINPRSKGKSPVAILTTNIAAGESLDFDATQVDASTARFGPNGAFIAHSQGHITDVDDDGDEDLLLHFITRETGIQCGDTEAVLIGETFAGERIAGSDLIKTVDCTN